MLLDEQYSIAQELGRDELEKYAPSATELVAWLAELEQDRIVYDEDEEAVVHVTGRLVAVMRSRGRGGSSPWFPDVLHVYGTFVLSVTRGSVR